MIVFYNLYLNSSEFIFMKNTLRELREDKYAGKKYNYSIKLN